MHRPLRGLVRATVLVTAGLLVTGPLGGCANNQEPAPPGTPTGTAPSLPVAAPLPLPSPQPPTGPPPLAPGLSAEDRGRLAEARRIGAPWVVLLVATAPERSEQVSAELRRLGGVLGTSPGPGYLRATAPTPNVEAIAALPAVTGLTIQQVIPPTAPRPTG